MHTFTFILGLVALALANPVPQNSDHHTLSPRYTRTSSVTTASSHPRHNWTDTACGPRASGYGLVPNPDTAPAFLNFAALRAISSSAPVPDDYSLVFKNLQAANNARYFLGSMTLKTYHPQYCAERCTSTLGCNSFNIFFERNPLINPGPTCSDPASSTVIKCNFWGGLVSVANAKYTGSLRYDFQIAITGSNGYSANNRSPSQGSSSNTAMTGTRSGGPWSGSWSGSWTGSWTGTWTGTSTRSFTRNPSNPFTRSSSTMSTTTSTMSTTASTTTSNAASTSASNAASTVTSNTSPTIVPLSTTADSTTPVITSSSAAAVTTATTASSTSTTTDPPPATTTTTNPAPATTTTTNPAPATTTTTPSTTVPITTSSTLSSTTTTTPTLTATTTSITTTTTTSLLQPTTTTDSSTAILTTISSTLSSILTTTTTDSSTTISTTTTDSSTTAITTPATTVPTTTPITTTSSTTTTTSGTPTPSLGGFVAQGCFSGGFLQSKSIPNAGNNSLEFCAAYCTGYTYMSVENGNGCSCGFTTTGSNTTANTGCTTACTGNGNETCGGFSRNQLYQNPSNTNTSPAPEQLALVDQTPVNGFVPQGCFSGGFLQSKSIPNAVNNSIEFCAAYCTGYTWMSVENGNGCSCGFNTTGSNITPNSGCYTACTGNRNETCGGFGRNQLFQNPSNTNTSPAPEQLSIQDQTPVAGFIPQGCFSGGFLISKSLPNAVNNSIEFCAAYCTGYTWMSVENGNGCSCGFTTTGNNVTPNTGCYTGCTGNRNETCGGFGRNQLYKNPSNTNTSPAPEMLSIQDQTPVAGFIPQGCFGGGALLSKQSVTANNSVEYCAAFCTGYTWMSVENGNVCSCGFAMNSTVSGGTPYAGCYTGCSGNSSEACGGFGRNNLYKNPANSNTAPFPQQLAPPDQVWAGSFQAQGCFSGSGGGNFITDISYGNSSNTPEQCAAYCVGYPYFSVENGNGCNCGSSANGTVGGGVPMTGCGTACTGNNNKTCGGFSRRFLYKSGTANVQGFNAIGCRGGGQLSSTYTNTTSNTLETCATFCNSYSYFSVENGTACSCGNQPNVTVSGGVQVGGCNTACSGNSTEKCGMLNKNNLYHFNGW